MLQSCELLWMILYCRREVNGIGSYINGAHREQNCVIQAESDIALI
jgi:hypothetical protein